MVTLGELVMILDLAQHDRTSRRKSGKQQAEQDEARLVKAVALRKLAGDRR